MSKIVWDATGEKAYELGVDHCVLYPVASNGTYPLGVAWNGITSISDSPDGGDPNDFYADNIKYGTLRGMENHGGSIEAYTYPDEWEECDGSAQLAVGVTIHQQTRRGFGLSYRTLKGDDVNGMEAGYIYHLVYGATASPSERSYETVNDSPDAMTFSWDYTTTPVPCTGHKPVSCINIDSTKFTTAAQKAKLEAFLDVIYGVDGDTYTVFTGDAFVDGVTYYEKVGNEYVVTQDTEMIASKTYYTYTSGTGIAPRLPLPDEVASLLTVA